MVSNPTSGHLKLEVVEAKLKRDTEAVGKMDPFCKLFLREETFITVVKHKAGKKPEWKQTFEIDVKYIGDDLKIECWDYEKIGGDDLIGATKIKVSALCANEGIDDWWPLSFNGKEAGKLRLKSKWQPLIIPAPANPLAIAGVVINSLGELER